MKYAVTVAGLVSIVFCFATAANAQAYARSHSGSFGNTYGLSSVTGVGDYDATSNMVTGNVTVNGNVVSASSWYPSTAIEADDGDTISCHSYGYLKNNTSSSINPSGNGNITVATDVDYLIFEEINYCHCDSNLCEANASRDGYCDDPYSYDMDENVGTAGFLPGFAVAVGGTLVYSGTMHASCH